MKCEIILARDAQILEARRFTPVYGDYAEKVYKVLKPRCKRESSTFKLKEIHDMLDVIAKGDRSGKSNCERIKS